MFFLHLVFLLFMDYYAIILVVWPTWEQIVLYVAPGLK